MLCQICKINPATIHIQELANGRKRTLHLCLSCAGKKTLANAIFDGLNLSDILSSLEQNLSGLVPPGFNPLLGNPRSLFEPDDDSDEPEPPACPECSWSEEQFHKTGLLGCPQCYEAFRKELENRFFEFHRSATHTGKPLLFEPAHTETPGGILDSAARLADRENRRQSELETLERDLKESVRREEFELATELRDKIRSIRRTLHSLEPEDNKDPKA